MTDTKIRCPQCGLLLDCTVLRCPRCSSSLLENRGCQGNCWVCRRKSSVTRNVRLD